MPEKLKNIFFTPTSLFDMADALERFYPKFDKKQFLSLVRGDGFDGKELKAKMRHVTECLKQTLPKSYKRSIHILKKAAPYITGFKAMCLPDYVEMYGLDDWETSLDAMALFTKYSSSEFAIRPFIIQDSKRAMAFLEKLAGDENENVRRFASEGCRPRLPWAMALPAFKKNPLPILPILEKLRGDGSEFVRRSVANNLNDISKDHPKLLLNICGKWHGKSKNTDRVVKHACRTLLKAGNRRAMLLFGFGDPKSIHVEKLKLDKKNLSIGDKVQFTFLLKTNTKKTSKVRLEYAVYFAKARGNVTKKVFQITENTFSPGEHRFARKHAFADMSTRKHHPGEHHIAVIVNGVEKAKETLVLKK